MTTNLLQLISKREKGTKDRELPPLFVPGCTKCGKVHMSLTCESNAPLAENREEKDMFHPAAARPAAYRERSGIIGQDSNNNNNAPQRNRNSPVKRGRGKGGGHRAREQRAPPTFASNSRLANNNLNSDAITILQSLMRKPVPIHGIDTFQQSTTTHFDRRNGNNNINNWRTASNSHHLYNNYNNNNNGRYRNERYPNGPPPRRGPRQAYSNGYGAPRPPPIRRVVPPNEAHMQMLNEQLKRFSYGTEDMYQEVPLPTPPPTMTQLRARMAAPPAPTPPPPAPVSKSSKPQSSSSKSSGSSIPTVPAGQMYLFRKETVYDEHGVLIKKNDLVQVARFAGHQVIIVDLDDELVM